MNLKGARAMFTFSLFMHLGMCLNAVSFAAALTRVVCFLSLLPLLIIECFMLTLFLNNLMQT